MKNAKVILAFAGAILITIVGLYLIMNLTSEPQQQATQFEPTAEQIREKEVSSDEQVITTPVMEEPAPRDGNVDRGDNAVTEREPFTAMETVTIKGSFIEEDGKAPSAMVGVLIGDFARETRNLQKWEGSWVLPIERKGDGSFQMEVDVAGDTVHLAAWNTDNQVVLLSLKRDNSAIVDFQEMEFRDPTSLNLKFENVPQGVQKLQARFFRMRTDGSPRVNTRFTVPAERYWLYHKYEEIYNAYDWPPEEGVDSTRSGLWDQSLSIDAYGENIFPALIPDPYVQLTLVASGVTYSERLEIPLKLYQESNVTIDWRAAFPDGVVTCFDLEGQVVKQGSGENIPGAVINFGSESFGTDEQGNFSVDCLNIADKYPIQITVNQNTANEFGIMKTTNLELTQADLDQIMAEGEIKLQVHAAREVKVTFPEDFNGNDAEWLVEDKIETFTQNKWLPRTADSMIIFGSSARLQVTDDAPVRITGFVSPIKGFTTGELEPGVTEAFLEPMTTKKELALEFVQSQNEYPINDLQVIVTADPLRRIQTQLYTDEQGQVLLEDLSARNLYVIADSPPRQREFLLPLVLNTDDKLTVKMEEGIQVIEPQHLH